jgi:hypothetical protein
VSPELIGVLIGGAITLAGTFVTQLIAIYQQNRTLRHERQKDLLLKRLVAIQNCVRMIDFLVSAKNATLGPEGEQEWSRIRKENSCNGALFPSEMTEEFKDMLRRSLLHDDLSNSEAWLDFQRLEALREACIRYIEKEFK